MFCSRCGTQVADHSKFCPSCGLDLSTATPTGSAKATPEPTEADIVRDALKDEYEILAELGRGGMAIVFKARDKQLDREVAVKVLPFSLAFDSEFVERFQREARTAARLEHPNIIPIYRVGKSGRVIYFVMKLLRGKSLSEVIEARGALPTDEIRRLLSEAAKALGYAHKNGIVHRDIKPDNIMMDELGQAVVTDFGIAKAASGTRLTGTGMAIGTPHYMSPEQARAQPLDGRSDIYSLGVVGYQCLAGSVPFDGEDSFSIGYKHIMEAVPEPPHLETADKRHVFEVIRRMLAKTAEERFQTADEVVAALEGTPAGTVPRVVPVSTAPTTRIPTHPMPGRASLPTGPAVGPSTPTTPIPKSPMPAPMPAKKKGSGVLVAALLLLVVGGGGGGYYWKVVMPEQARLKAESDSLEAARAEIGRLQDSIRNDSIAKAATTAAAAAAPATPAASTGVILLRGAPRGYRVTVDAGESTAPAGDSLVVDPGTHRVRIIAAGFQPFEQQAIVAKGQRLTVDVRMQASVAQAPPATQRPNRGVAEGRRGQPPAQTPPVASVTPPRRDSNPPAATAGPPDCESWGPDYGTRGCYDASPRPKGPPQVQLPAGFTGNPSPAVILVFVNDSGRVRTAQNLRPSNDPNFTLLAIEFAKSMEFNPAQKDGKPVAAFQQVQLFPKR